MRNHNVMLIFSAAALLALFAGCASTSAPSDWLDDPELAGLDGFGAWVEVQLETKRLSGELIAVSADSLFFADSTIRVVAVQRIASARLVAYDAPALVAPVLLGTLSTASHGLLLVFTAPMWIIAGSISAGARTYDPIIDYPEKRLAEFRPYARFPQGLPKGLDRGRIRMKQLRR